VIGQVDDHVLFDSIDRGVRFVDEAAQTFGQPVIAPGLAAVAVHALLDHDPVSVIGDDEAMEIKVRVMSGELRDAGAWAIERLPSARYSAAVSTATTPGAAEAVAVSIAAISAWACGERNTQAMACPGRLTSSP
jgi:hypothetical protein